MRFDQYSSEAERHVQAILDTLAGREETLMTIFIQRGPDKLKKLLRVEREADWNIIFDHLVFKKNLLKRCVLQFLAFFKNLVAEKGPLAMCRVLGIEAPMYDEVFETLFDLVAIAHGSLFDFLYANSSEFVEQIKKGKGGSLRAQLCLTKKKYDQTWVNVLEILSKSMGEQMISEALFERSLASFNAIMNGVRVQRSLRTYKLV